MNEEIKVTLGSDNVFEDLGFPDAAERLTRTDLAIAIKKEIEARGWTQQQAAEHTHVSQPAISKIMRLRLTEFSNDRLQDILRSLGIDVEIKLHKREDGGIGTIRVLQAI